MTRSRRILILGYGNPCRADDGLGPALADCVAELGIPGVTTQVAFQLDVGDAALVTRYDVALFADAATSGPEPFSCTGVIPGKDAVFGTHHIDPEWIMFVAHMLYQRRTKAYLLGIRGYEFNLFNEGLSGRARENLACAVAYVQKVAVANWHF